MLIVDDDPLMRDMLPRRLRRALHADVRIETATTPDEARKQLERCSPDVILCDYNLRHVQTGLDVLREAEEIVPRAVRILFSAHTPREIQGLGSASIHAYLEKPFRLDELIEPFLSVVTREGGIDLRGGPRAE